MPVTRIKNNQITDATIVASAKLVDYSITAGKIANDLTYGSNLTVTGNLTVNGTTTTIDTYDLVVEDPLILLAKNQTGSPSLDIGFIGKRGTSDNIAFVWDESADQFVAVFTTSEVTNTTISINSYASMQVLDITANNANITGNLTFSGNIVGSFGVTGNITANNINSNNAISTVTLDATGNITGGNLTTTGIGNIGTLAVTGTANVTGNATVGNLSTPGQISATGNITATANLNGNNATITNNISTATLNTTGNVEIGGNLIVQGNITYINIDDLRVEDPIIVLGTGPNGAPLTVDDGKDRGVFMEYYITGTGTGNAFMGWDNSTGNMILANSATIANDVVTVSTFGTTQVGTLYAQNVLNDGNVTTPNVVGKNSLTLTTQSNGNITINPDGTGVIILTDEAANSVIYTGANKEISTDANLTFDGANLALIGQATLDNVVVDGSDITSNTSELTINNAGADVNFRVEGDTDTNLFVTDAGTDTVLIGTGTPVTNAKLVINSTNSILIPVGNSLQRPATGVTGMIRFNTTTNSLEFYDSDSWESAGTTFTIVVSDQFTGDGSTVAFTLSQDSTTAATIVAINGVVQIPVTAYSVTGNVLTFTEAPISTDVIDARILTTTTTVTALQNTTGNAVIEAQESAQAFDITGSLIPTANVTFDLGNSTNRFRDGYFAGNSITLGNIVMKNTGGNSFGIFGPDGTTPATLDANVTVVGDEIAAGTSNVSFATGGGNIRLVVGGTNTANITATGANITGTLNVSGNANVGNIGATSIVGTLTTASQTNITAVGTLGSLSVTGNVAGGNITTAGQVVATGNITGGNLSGTSIVGTLTTASQTNITSVGTLGSLSVTGNVNAGNLNVNTGNVVLNTGALIVGAGGIVNSNANGVGNIGSSGGYFNTVFAKATSAQYADLAEMYEADADYTPGTVVAFGGAKEVTQCAAENDTRVAGVVSTNPSYIMNANQSGEHVVAVALTGRVPCRVTGAIRKGDLMVSAGNGMARADNNPRVGSIIGKALADFDGAEGVIEVVVGRF